jgi:linoleate 9S-lipoxygenase
MFSLIYSNILIESFCLLVEQAIQDERLFILNYHDAFLPYLKWINNPVPKSYATRTILFLKDDGTLKPLN